MLDKYGGLFGHFLLFSTIHTTLIQNRDFLKSLLASVLPLKSDKPRLKRITELFTKVRAYKADLGEISYSAQRGRSQIRARDKPAKYISKRHIA